MDIAHSLYIIQQKIKEFKLDYSGLTLITECASGYYAFAPIIGLMAGAEVIALGKDTAYGTFEENKKFIQSIIEGQGIKGKIEFHKRSEFKEWGRADVITNSGQLRPLSEEVVVSMKNSAVIPLMWEAWEFRKEDLDLYACQQKDIAVIGSYEHYKHANLYNYLGILALKLLLDLKVEIANNHLVLIGGHDPGKAIAEMLEGMGIPFTWFTETAEEDPKCYPYKELKRVLEMNYVDAIVNIEHHYGGLLIGKEGIVSFTELKKKHPFIKYAQICGNIDTEELKTSGVPFLPERIAPFGYMSYQPHVLGPRPIIEILSLGMKVGEVYARSRQAGNTVEQGIHATVESGVGMDFPGGFYNFKLS